MEWHRTSTVDHLPVDPVGEAMAVTVSEMVVGSSVELHYSPLDGPVPLSPDGPGLASARGSGPSGWEILLVVRLDERLGQVLTPGPTIRDETLEILPAAALATASRLRPAAVAAETRPLLASLRRSLRDAIAGEVLRHFLLARLDAPVQVELLDETLEYLIELSGSRVESHDLTHGVLIADVLPDRPRLRFAYPGEVRAAKRAPLLFDGIRSLLVVDPTGHARTEIQAHRLDELERFRLPAPSTATYRSGGPEPTGTLVAEATRRLGGLGFFLRADRTIWTFVDGQPLLVRRGEHWMTFPLQLATSIAHIIGEGAAALIVARAAFMVSAQRRGAILAIVRDREVLDGTVSRKDRYDLRSTIDPLAMRAETRLHHLIDATDLDEHTLARLSGLDGATIVDRDGHLVAYGAIVASADSQHEGARTAAARSLSELADIVLKVSVDGDITIFRRGEAVTTLLGRPSHFEL